MVLHHLSRSQSFPPPGPSQGSAAQEQVSLICWATCTLLGRGRELRGGPSKVQELCCRDFRNPDKSLAGRLLGLLLKKKTGKVQEMSEERKRNNFPRPDK